MSKNYYYNCPIIAAYMSKEFGVRFKDLIKDNEVVCIAHKIIDEDRMNGIREKYYILSESEHIFEPKIEDLGIDLRGEFCEFVKSDWVDHIGNNDNYSCWLPIRKLKDDWIWEDSEIKIILRDNKQFFMPKIKE